MKIDIDKFSVRFTQTLLAQQKTAVFVLAVVFILSLWGISRLTFSNDYRIFFSDSNPELKDLNDFQVVYGQSDSIFVVIHNPQGSVFNETIIPDIELLVEQAEDIENVSRVEAVTNFPDIILDNDQLTVQSLIEDSQSMDVDDYLLKQKQALANTVIRGGLLSPAADTTAINIVFNFPQESAMEVLDAADAVRQLTGQFADNHPGLELGLSGIVMLNAAFSETGIHDLMYLLPIMFAVLFAVLFFLIRSVVATLIIFIAIGYSCIFALGMAGFFAIPITVVSVASIIIIMTLAVANGMHLLFAMISAMSKENNPDKKTLIIDSVKINFVPVALTSITTIVSFLTLNFSDVPPYWHLGNITALGVFAAWILTFIMLPILMQGMAIVHHSVAHTENQERRMSLLAHWVIRQHRWILLIGMLVSIGVVSQIPKLMFNDQFIHYFSKNIEFRRDAEFMEKHLSGLFSIEYMIPAQQEDGILQMEYLQNLDAYTTWLYQQKEVRHIYSFVDVMKQINWNMNGQDNQSLVLPEDNDTAAQNFLMYELSLADDSSLESRISLDKSSTRLSVIVSNLSSVEMQHFVERSAAWQKAHFPEYMQANATGPAVMFAYISKRNIKNMMQGNAVSLILITAIMLLLLRSFSLGALSMLVNAMPLIMMFGVWTIAVGEVGMVGTTISSAALGIIVDDTIHFLTKYQRLKNAGKFSAKESVIQVFEKAGVAIVSTSVVLVAGLSVLIASDFQLNQQAGLLTVISIILALLFDILILPAALVFFARDNQVENSLRDVKELPVP